MFRIFAICWIVWAMTAAQESRLTYQARRENGKASNELNVTNPVSTLPDLLNNSDVVVRGRVQNISTRLRETHDYVLTEWNVIPLRVYKGQPAARNAPGPSRPLVVRKLGGTTIFEGLELTTKVSDFSESESLRVGEEAVFFLVKDQTRRDAFALAAGPYGLFRVRGQRIHAVTERAAQRRGDDPQWLFADFERDVLRILNDRR